jgi:hypothetical protein
MITLVEDRLMQQSDGSQPQQEEVLERLTGIKYAVKRQLACPVDGCKKRFMRDYDIERHIESFHPENVKDQDEPSQ